MLCLLMHLSCLGEAFHLSFHECLHHQSEKCALQANLTSHHSAAAARAGIPSAIISNFTFDSCYSYLSVSTLKDNSTASLSRAMQGAQLNEATNTLQVPSGSSPSSPISDDEDDEPPIPAEEIEPLVRQVTEDYANASLLLRLPGCIPIPAFDTDVPMPAELWTNLEAHSFKNNIMDLLARDTEEIPACTCLTNGSSSTSGKSNEHQSLLRRRQRKVINTPLIARPVAQNIYTKDQRSKILSELGIPEHQHDPETTRILVVSFGGQSIPKPSASRPPTPLPSSRNGSLSAESGTALSGMNGINGQEKTNGDRVTNSHNGTNGHNARDDHAESHFQHTKPTLNGLGHVSGSATPLGKSISQQEVPSLSTSETPPVSASLARARTAAPRLQRLMTEDHIYLPGAPPALHKPHQMNATSMSMKSSTSSGASTKHRRKISLEIPKIYQSEGDASTTVEEQIQMSIAEASFESEGRIDSGTSEGGSFPPELRDCDHDVVGGGEEDQEEQLIPKGWIAIVCGLSVKDGADELPENFYAAPRDVYVPDLTAVCDVLLGKLGYGTCSETVSSQTPFVYGKLTLSSEERWGVINVTSVPQYHARYL